MKKIILSVILALGLGVCASDLVIESNTQTYSEADAKIKFDGNVKVKIDELTVSGDNADVTIDKKNKPDLATFYNKPYAVEVKKNKKREVKANILQVSLITKIIRAEGDTQSVVFDGQVPIVVINSDVQEYDTKTGIMTASGSVIILYKDIETFSDNAVIKSGKGGELQNIELTGSAKIKAKGLESSGDKLVYNDSSKILTAAGNTISNVIMDDGTKFVIKSSYQELMQAKNVFNATGNVRVWYQDYYATGPKMTVYPDPKTNKANEIYFTGRSSITQGVRTIYADKIKMMMNPKDFQAEGNTRTVIKNIGSGTADVGL
jgi:lipopolysaccharide export system protein LptA